MRRRTFLQSLAAAGCALLPRAAAANDWLALPVCIYNNWSAYDELSDAVRLDERLEMRQFDELLRLRSKGVHVDGGTLDAFWFDPKGGYRTFLRDWPEGPDRWLERCRRTGLAPGLGSARTRSRGFGLVAQWQESLTAKKGFLSLFEGGFLAHFMATLEMWHARGVRSFKFDFTDLDAATAEAQRTLSPAEITSRNTSAFRAALVAFRDRHPDALLLGYNGLGGDFDNTSYPFKKTVDTEWLDAFDSLYCGDPRPSDTPAMRFWRSLDIYSDQMARRYEQNGMPLGRIDNCAFMMGRTGTCYYRGKAGWKGSLVLSLARGGRMNTYYGNLEQFTDAEARWFAHASRCGCRSPHTARRTRLGRLPRVPTRTGSCRRTRAVRSTQSSIPIRRSARSHCRLDHWKHGRLLFADAGHVPVLHDTALTLGPEQMAVIGAGTFNQERHEPGTQEDVLIPRSIERLDVSAGEAVDAQALGTLRAQQADPANHREATPARRRGRANLCRRPTQGHEDGLGAGHRGGPERADGPGPDRIRPDDLERPLLGGRRSAGRRPVDRLPVQIKVGSREKPPIRITIEAYAVGYSARPN